MVDLALVAVAAVDALPAMPRGWYREYIVSVIAVLAIPLRRKLPFATLLVCMPGAYWGPTVVAPMVAMFTVADRSRRSLVWLGAAVVLVGQYLPYYKANPLGPSDLGNLQTLIYALLIAGQPTALGLLARARRQVTVQLRELQASRAREQSLLTESVRSTERTRLAREMHDVVSHQVSLIALQAGAWRVTANDEKSRSAASTIRTLAVTTLDELRHMVGVLRGSGTDSELAPQPRLRDLRRLVEASATNAQLELHGVLSRTWPEAVERAVYRTVQEGLTNASKHAPGSEVWIEVSDVGGALEVRVRNKAPEAVPGPDTELPKSGHGLVGLRERAELLGGRMSAALTGDGGYELKATFVAYD
jgi:signal transduction histidine kinase